MMKLTRFFMLSVYAENIKIIVSERSLKLKALHYY